MAFAKCIDFDYQATLSKYVLRMIHPQKGRRSIVGGRIRLHQQIRRLELQAKWERILPSAPPPTLSASYTCFASKYNPAKQALTQLRQTPLSVFRLANLTLPAVS
ncbi:DNA repair protein Rad50 [Pseudozyma hubeiensis SY62]|uniref:DNA repair protein Rad50 n=1 Tax=Pseudozyma hubeiensis (strain SY62) TaxID=1305764 RepID=R9P5C8_PSEHS|nr:DNA repair protein Rad50 [Pseudozyma hubeiensis SY62]GAC96427.1 DNA repair protein Rad50 [Pseudozyma hubeiensis SY62]